MDDQKRRKRNKNKAREARRAAKKRSGSLSEHTEVLPQDATEVASSNEEEQWDEGESMGDALRAVPDEPEPTKTNLSSGVSEEQFGVITPHLPPVTSVKKVVIRTDEYLKKSEVEETVEELLFDVESISKPLRKVPSSS